MIHLNNKKEIKDYILYGDFEKLINEKNIGKNYSEKTCDLIKTILVKNPKDRPSIDKIIQECKDILFNFDLKKKPCYNKSSFNLEILSNLEKTETVDKKFFQGEPTIVPEEVELQNDFPKCEDILRETMTKITTEGFKLINNEIVTNKKKKKFRESFYIDNNEEREEKKIDTSKPIKNSDNKSKRNNNPAPHAQPPQELGFTNLVIKNIFNLKTRDFEDYYSPKYENNNNGEEKYEEGKYKESNIYENGSDYFLLK